ncbi:squalene synthase HpnC [Anderseniella sp. Alg231-50]|uniref:squalene synthase HpnC n=1 Tax=Anderseniella sp. Alg231-50 TaxID=1922226 RepID=UPI000D55FE1C
MSNQPKSVETPSGKGAADENFPVGSFLLPKRLRPHVMTYYAFARAIDDIADNPDALPQDKITGLNAMDDALLGREKNPDESLAKATALRASMLETNVDLAHGSDLVSAFRQDAVQSRYNTWDDLIDYCLRSAAPVGRYLLELHGEDKAHFEYSDALCNALQVINHLQDCADDLRELDRCYLPLDWCEETGANIDMLREQASPPALRAVQMKCIEGTESLLRLADKLPGKLNSKSLAMESGVIISIAWKLVDKLKRQDPVAKRVELSKPQFMLYGLKGAIKGLF